MPDLQNPYPAAPYPAQSSIAGPIRVIAIIHFILGGLAVLGAAILFATGAFAHHQVMTSNTGGTVGGTAFFAFLGGFAFLLGLFQILVGYGLITFKSWGRILAIILSCFNLLSFPFGTVLGGFTLYFLLRSGAAEEYQRLALTT